MLFRGAAEIYIEFSQVSYFLTFHMSPAASLLHSLWCVGVILYNKV